MRKRKLTMRTGALCTLCACVLSAALLAPACTENLGLAPAGSGRDLVLGLKMEPATKVAVDDVSGGLAWTAGDAVAVRIYGKFPEENTYKIAAVDVSSSTVNVELEGDQDIRWYSVYPASARVDNQYGVDVNTAAGALHVVYPASYAVPSGLSGEALNKWSPVPMVAANTDGGTPPTPKSVLDFYHVGGVLRIKLSNVPAGTTSCTVTLEGMSDITGTFKVENPGTATAHTDVLVAGTVAGGDNNTVEFTGIPSSTAKTTLWLNVPLPTGNYSSLASVKVEAKAGGTLLDEMEKAVKWTSGTVVHAQGRRLSFDFDAEAGDLDNVKLAPAGDATLWKGQPYQCVAQGCDAEGLYISGANITWASGNTTVAEVDNDGNVTAKAAGSASLTATVEKNGITKTASYTVYVNEITGLTLSCGTAMTLTAGSPQSVTATATYTTNGTPEVPEVDWVVAPATLATLGSTTTASGAANTLTGGATVGSGTLTVSIPANKYGSNAALAAMCSFNIINPNYISGLFSISPTEQVYFSKGNLQVNYTNNGGTVTREWLFSENQWDYFCPTAAERNSLPTPAEGTTVKLSHFGWATAGHENPDSPGGSAGGRTHYGYATHHKAFEPHIKNGMIPPGYNIAVGDDDYNPVDEGTWSNLFGEARSWNSNEVLRSYCDWGVHFDDAGVGHENKYDGSWFTMDIEQWLYLFRGRTGAAEKLAAATIVVDPGNSIAVTGFVLIPDIWQCPAGCSFSASLDAFDANTYDVGTTWDLMEASGVVFLPAGGYRPNTSGNIGYSGTGAYYWSSSTVRRSSAYNNYYAYLGGISLKSSGNQNPARSGAVQKGSGLTVRLVRKATL